MVVLVNVFKSDSEPSDRGDQIIACNEPLRSGGPYVSGVDPEYDRRMDWDGDGVSCERGGG